MAAEPTGVGKGPPIETFGFKNKIEKVILYSIQKAV